MPKHAQDNALYNSQFRFWDYGTALNFESMPTIPYLATRWKIAPSGGIRGTITKGAGPSDIAIPKWLRSQNTLQVNLTGIPAGANVTVQQHVEDASQYGQTFALLSTVHSGPMGAVIYVGVGDYLKPVTMQGPGVPVSTTHAFMLGDFATSSMAVTVFSNPKTGGTYHVHYAQLALGLDRPRHSGFTVRTEQEDRTACNRYAYPITGGVSGPATASRLSIPLQFQNPMRAIPSLASTAATVNIVDIATGIATAVSPPTVTANNVTVTGCRLAVTGMTTLPAASTQMVTSAVLGVLHADF